MKRRRLGQTDIEVSEIALGTMMFGSWGQPNHAECGRMVARAIAGGINFFDSADIYDFGQSEQILGAALGYVKRDSYVVATKVGNPMSQTDDSMRGLSARWISQSCENSLTRLGVEHIDLYQAHRPDPETPLDETVEAFGALVAAGKVRAVGTSCFSAAQIAEWNRLAAESGVAGLTTEQPPYSILARGIETEIVPAAQNEHLSLVVWAPLNGGWLTGKYQADAIELESRAQREPAHFDHADAEIRSRKRELVSQLQEVAAQAGLSIVQLSVGFVLARPEVGSALVGPRTLEQLDALLSRAIPQLSADVLAAIDRIVAPGTNINPADAG